MSDISENSYKYALCLVDIKVLGTKTFSYLIPDSMKGTIKIGQPVIVPFGFGKGRKLKAYIVGFSNYLEEGIKAKYIDEILDNGAQRVQNLAQKKYKEVLHKVGLGRD